MPRRNETPLHSVLSVDSAKQLFLTMKTEETKRLLKDIKLINLGNLTGSLLYPTKRKMMVFPLCVACNAFYSEAR